MIFKLPTKKAQALVGFSTDFYQNCLKELIPTSLKILLRSPLKKRTIGENTDSLSKVHITNTSSDKTPQ